MTTTTRTIALSIEPTLAFALRARGLATDPIPGSRRVRRALGEMADVEALLGIWPAARTTLTVLVPTLLDVPGSELGLGLEPRLRDLVARGVAPDPAKEDERAVADLARAAAAVPPRIDPAAWQRVSDHLPVPEVESLVLAVTAMGFVDGIRDALGLVGQTLEPVESPPAEGWLDLLWELPAVMAADARALAGVPLTPWGQVDWLEAELGFVPGYLADVYRNGARRVLGHLLVERLWAPDGELTRVDRQRIGFVVASVADDRRLAAHAAFLVHRAGGTTDDLVDAVRAPADPCASRHDALTAFAHGIAGPRCALDQRAIDALIIHFTPQAIVELVLTAAIWSSLVRLSACHPGALEPEVRAFLAREGLG